VLKTRVIPTLLYKDFGLVKGVRFDSRRAVGSAMQAIKVYNLRQVDELVFFDVTATLRGAPPDYELIDDLADDCFMPLTVGGGVRTVEHVAKLLSVGADRVCLGTAAVETPELVREAQTSFGIQCIVVSVDVHRAEDGTVEVRSHSGTKSTGIDPVEFARQMEDLGAGELIVQSVDRDGTMTGYDVGLVRSIAGAVTVPVVASGGCETYEDMAVVVLEGGASAVAAASIFHYTEQTPLEAKQYMHDRGIPTRK